MRCIAVVLLPGIAVADTRLDLSPMPELYLLESVFHLDRGTERSKRSTNGVIANVGLGIGGHQDENGAVGEGLLLVGNRTKRTVAAASSELVLGGNALARGRHAGLLELRTHERDDGGLGGMLALGTNVEHGEARALAPVWLGPGKRNHASASAEALIRLESDKDDLIWTALVGGDGSITKWIDAPVMDRAYRRALQLGVTFVAEDEEVPRGRLDVVTTRIEHSIIKRQLRAANAPLGDTQVRTIDVMSGVNQLAGYIDHELLFAVTIRFGGTWIESESTAKPITDTFFKMELGGHLKWLKKRNATREFGLIISRQPGPSADGQHHVSDWRLAMVAGGEDKKFVVGVRGGATWITHKSGAGDGRETIKRYGSHIEGFYKVGLGIEVGVYHVMSFEPRMSEEPWAAEREFLTELGALVRWRGSKL